MSRLQASSSENHDENVAFKMEVERLKTELLIAQRDREKLTADNDELQKAVVEAKTSAASTCSEQVSWTAHQHGGAVNLPVSDRLEHLSSPANGLAAEYVPEVVHVHQERRDTAPMETSNADPPKSAGRQNLLEMKLSKLSMLTERILSGNSISISQRTSKT